MLVAESFPLLDIFWSMLFFFLWVGWLMILFNVIVDIFRSKDLGGLAKASWTIFAIVLPVLGVLVYLIARGSKMAERAAADAKAQEIAFRSRVRTAVPPGPGDQLTQLSALRDSGAISVEEYEAGKSKILA